MWAYAYVYQRVMVGISMPSAYKAYIVVDV